MAAEDNIFIVKMSNHTVPRFVETRNKQWVLFGEQNDYPEYLLKLYERSPYHGAIINGKKNYVKGKGFAYNPNNGAEQAAQVEAWLKNINPSESADEVLDKLVLDYKIHGGFYLQVIYTNGKKIYGVYHVPFHKIRAGKYLGKDVQQSANTEQVFDYYYSDNWIAYRQTLGETGLRGFDAYNPANPTGTQILYFGNYSPSSAVYPLPDYINCIGSIETDAEVEMYDLNNIKNRFTASQMINFFNGEPTNEEKISIEQRIKNKFKGSDGGERFILNFSDSPDKAATISPIQQPDLDKLAAGTDSRSQQKIFTGHQITNPAILGIKTAGQLGNRDELREASELFQNTYVTPDQMRICKVFNRLLNDMGVQGEPLIIIPIESLKWEFSERTISTAVTKDEIREVSGFKPKNIKGLTDVIPPVASVSEAPVKMHSHERMEFRAGTKEEQAFVLSLYKKYGRPIEGVKLQSRRVRFSAEMPFPDTSEIIKQEFRAIEDAKALYFADPVSGSVSTISAAILKYLKSHPNADSSTIAKATGINEAAINEEMNTLVIDGYIGSDNMLTSKGSDLIGQQPRSVTIENVYQYDVLPGLGAPIIDTTRDFCRELINLNMQYTRNDIEMMSNEAGFSVWLYRGGFYHNPDTGITTPYCRHDWFRHTITREN